MAVNRFLAAEVDKALARHPNREPVEAVAELEAKAKASGQEDLVAAIAAWRLVRQLD